MIGCKYSLSEQSDSGTEHLPDSMDIFFGITTYRSRHSIFTYRYSLPFFARPFRQYAVILINKALFPPADRTQPYDGCKHVDVCHFRATKITTRPGAIAQYPNAAPNHSCCSITPHRHTIMINPVCHVGGYPDKTLLMACICALPTHDEFQQHQTWTTDGARLAILPRLIINAQVLADNNSCLWLKIYRLALCMPNTRPDMLNPDGNSRENRSAIFYMP